MEPPSPKEMEVKKKYDRMIESVENLLTQSFTADDLTILRSVLDSSITVNMWKSTAQHGPKINKPIPVPYSSLKIRNALLQAERYLQVGATDTTLRAGSWE